MTPPSTTETPQPSASAATRPRVVWWRRPWILPLALLTVVFLGFSLPPYAGLDPDQARTFSEDPWRYPWHYPVLVTHIFAGAVIMLAMVLQVWPWLRRHHPKVHRWSGRVYVFVGVPFVGVASLLLSPFSSSGPGTAVSNTLFSLLWLIFTVVGYRMVRQRRYAEHRVWMLRSFALTLAIITNRFWGIACTMLLIPQLDTVFGGDEQALLLVVAPMTSWLSWVVNLLVVEWWIQHRKPRRGVRSGGGTRARSGERTPGPAAM